MKPLILFGVALAAEAAVVKQSGLEKRQFGSFLFNPLPNGVTIAKQKLLQPVVSSDLKAERFPEASRKQAIFGPFKIRPANDSHTSGLGGFKLDRHSDLFENPLGGLCSKCVVLDMKFDVTDKTGRKLGPKDDVYTHHMAFGAVGSSTQQTALSTSNMCPNGFGGFSLGSIPTGGFSFPAGGLPSFGSFLPTSGSGSAKIAPIFVKGQEENAINFSPLNATQQKSGVWVGKNDTLVTSVEVVNYRTAAQDVYVTADIEFLNFDEKPKDYLDAKFEALIGMDCSNIGMNPPADRMVTWESAEYNVDKPSLLVNLNPHLHDGAIDMKIHVNGKVVCQANAVYGQNGGMSLGGEQWETIKNYTPCDTVKLSRGDKIKMTSDYDVRQHRLRPDSAHTDMEADSMAIAFIQFAYTG